MIVYYTFESREAIYTVERACIEYPVAKVASGNSGNGWYRHTRRFSVYISFSSPCTVLVTVVRTLFLC